MSRHVLVPLDGSALADAVIPRAADVAHRLHAGLLLVRVHHPSAMLVTTSETALYVPDPAWEDAAITDAATWLDEKAAAARDMCDLRVEPLFRVGLPAEQIVAIARERRVHAIVCCTQGMGGLGPHWLGSVADALVRTAPCPVLAMSVKAVARPNDVRRILVPLDGSIVSASVLPHAAWCAHLFDAELELFRVAPPSWVGDMMVPGSSADEDVFGIDMFVAAVKTSLDDTAAQLRAEGLRVRATVEVDGYPTHAILRHVTESDPDIVVMATHGRGLSRLFFGSVADKVLRVSGRPTLLVQAGTPVAETRRAAVSVALAQPSRQESQTIPA